jgi:hypothetical protein
MRVISVIVDNRDIDINVVLNNHLPFLPESWDFKHIKDIPINSGHDYNKLLTSVSFWNQFLDYDKVFIFQHDSCILQSGFDEFLKYDYVGAPWRNGSNWQTSDRRGGNGGISIRGVHATIKCLQTYHYNVSYWNEDVYFSHNMENVAPYEVCAKFGVEAEFCLGTKTYHAIGKHLTETECNQIITQYD